MDRQILVWERFEEQHRPPPSPADAAPAGRVFLRTTHGCYCVRHRQRRQSRSVQAAAVELARAAEAAGFRPRGRSRQMGELEEALRPAAQAELAWLGEAILRLAQDRARRQGVQAESEILHGNVCAALEDFLTHRRSTSC